MFGWLDLYFLVLLLCLLGLLVLFLWKRFGGGLVAWVCVPELEKEEVE